MDLCAAQICSNEYEQRFKVIKIIITCFFSDHVFFPEIGLTFGNPGFV